MSIIDECGSSLVKTSIQFLQYMQKFFVKGLSQRTSLLSTMCPIPYPPQSSTEYLRNKYLISSVIQLKNVPSVTQLLQACKPL